MTHVDSKNESIALQQLSSHCDSMTESIAFQQLPTQCDSMAESRESCYTGRVSFLVLLPTD